MYICAINKNSVVFLIPLSNIYAVISKLKNRTKMQKIEISQTNVFEEKAKTFSETKLALRLQDKYKAKPYEERRKNIYLLSQIISYFCNSIAIVASASFVFAFLYSLVVKVLPYPVYVAGIISCSMLFLIEFGKREIVPDFFKDVFQYGFKGNYIIRIAAMVGLISISTLFSYKGGHEFVALVMSEPQYIAPTEKSSKDIQERYKSQKEQATRNAEAYKKTRTWQGKLSDADGKQYQKLLDKITTLSEQENKEIQAIQIDNRKTVDALRKDFEVAKNAYSTKLEQRGTGFSLFSIVGELIFILCIWFMERFDYKTATQYAVIIYDTAQTTTEIATQATIDNKLTTQIIETATLHTDIKDRENLPIGFYQHGRENAEKLLQQVSTPYTGTSVEKIVYDDKYTILHKGKRTTQRYTLGRINNIIGTYQERIHKAKDKGRLNIARKNEQTLNYWETKKKELLAKM